MYIRPHLSNCTCQQKALKLEHLGTPASTNWPCFSLRTTLEPKQSTAVISDARMQAINVFAYYAHIMYTAPATAFISIVPVLFSELITMWCLHSYSMWQALYMMTMATMTVLLRRSAANFYGIEGFHSTATNTSTNIAASQKQTITKCNHNSNYNFTKQLNSMQ